MRIRRPSSAFTVLALSLVATSAMAADNAPAAMVEAYFAIDNSMDADIAFGPSFTDDGNGFGLRGQVDAGEFLQLHAGFENDSFDLTRMDFDTLRLGAGAYTLTADGDTRFAAALELVDVELSTAAASASADGIGLVGQVSHRANDKATFHAQLALAPLEDNAGAKLDYRELRLGLGLAANERVAFLLELCREQLEDNVLTMDTTAVRIGGRLQF